MTRPLPPSLDAARPPTAPSSPATAAPLRVMLLSLWAPPASAWRARLVEADACTHEFDSPLELARFLAQAPADALPSPPSSAGLR